MAYRRDKLNKIDSQPAVNQAGTHVVRIEGGARGKRVFNVKLKCGAGAGIKPGDAYGDIRVITEDKTRRTHTLRQLDRLNSLRGSRFKVVNLETVGGVAIATIPFAEFDRKQYIAAERPALDVLPGETVRIEVDSNSKAAVGALSARAFWQDLDEALGVKAENITPAMANLGVLEITRIPMRYNGTETIIQDFIRTGILSGISLYNPGASEVADGEPITSVEVDTDTDGVIFTRTKEENDIELGEHELEPNTKIFDIVPDATDNPDQQWRWTKYGRFDVKLTTAAASANDVLAFVQKFIARR